MKGLFKLVAVLVVLAVIVIAVRQLARSYLDVNVSRRSGRPAPAPTADAPSRPEPAPTVETEVESAPEAVAEPVVAEPETAHHHAGYWCGEPDAHTRFAAGLREQRSRAERRHPGLL